MYKATVNEDLVFDILAEQIGQAVPIGERQWQVFRNNRSYTIFVSELNKESKTAVLQINGNRYTVVVQDEMSLLLEKMGVASTKRISKNDLKAPMPGLVLEVKVVEGSKVQKGDTLIVLEAMKMENAIKASEAGSVRQVLVRQGNAVEKNQVLIVMD